MLLFISILSSRNRDTLFVIGDFEWKEEIERDTLFA
jgi:hypothetical protein